MEIKKEFKKVVKEVEVYVTPDGYEFEDEEDAKGHIAIEWFENNKKDIRKTPDMPFSEFDLYKVDNKEEFDLLSYYMYDVNGYCFDVQFDIDNIEYPAYLCYNDNGDIYSISKSLYEELVKHINIGAGYGE